MRRIFDTTAVQEGLRQGGVPEDLGPTAELQVRGDADALSLVPLRKELEQGGSSGTQAQVAQFVHHHEVIPVVGFEHPGEAVFVLGQEQFLGQRQGGGEPDCVACGDAGCGYANGHMGLAGPRVPQENQVLPATKEVPLGQGQDLLLRQGGKAQEVVLREGAGVGKPRSLQEVLQPFLPSGGPFRLQAFPEVALGVGGDDAVSVVSQDPGEFEVPAEGLDGRVPVAGRSAHATASPSKVS